MAKAFYALVSVLTSYSALLTCRCVLTSQLRPSSLTGVSFPARHRRPGIATERRWLQWAYRLAKQASLLLLPAFCRRIPRWRFPAARRDIASRLRLFARGTELRRAPLHHTRNIWPRSLRRDRSLRAGKRPTAGVFRPPDLAGKRLPGGRHQSQGRAGYCTIHARYGQAARVEG